MVVCFLRLPQRIGHSYAGIISLSTLSVTVNDVECVYCTSSTKAIPFLETLLSSMAASSNASTTLESTSL
ncbi:hypothetical protein Nepgr_020681 [Nepenthes gracilis]|uniref:Uncharacterized protein n=1 Tax=Nepenthes gracilis TaxID=150966 RepID=A0AAD3XWH6_NEPGR|nr:hypothetical protein Nepgr_020681 [Nepenthes gracilis]